METTTNYSDIQGNWEKNGKDEEQLFSKFWCFTVNNPTKQLQPELWNPKLPDTCKITWMVWQLEVGKDGTPHYQGYIEIGRSQRRSWIMRLPGLETCWTKPRYINSNSERASAYCQKPETRVEGPWTFGKMNTKNDGEVKHQGKRTDWDDIKEDIKRGAPMRKIAENHFEKFVKYGKALSLYQKMCKPLGKTDYDLSQFKLDKLDLKKPVLLHGPSGTGKTGFALAHFKNPLLVSHADDLGRLDPSEHDGIVFDDMSFTHYPAESVIHLLDIEMDRSVNCRYICGELPKGMPRIFTHNSGGIFEGPDDDRNGKRPYLMEQRAAIKRRYNRVEVLQDLRIIADSQPDNGKDEEELVAKYH